MADDRAPWPTFDPAWEQDVYAVGRQLNRYPFDSVVSFVFRNLPADRPRGEVALLEVGCGAGNNVWFAAREGLRVSGIDASPTAVEHARARLAREGLAADLRVGDFVSLPFEDEGFDLVVDRGSLTHVAARDAAVAVREVHRVLRPGGRFLFTPYSDRHASAHSGTRGDGGLVRDMRAGTLAGVAQIRFYDRAAVLEALGTGWVVREMRHLLLLDERGEPGDPHAEWRVVAEKRA